jgi:hypothetical protein
VRLSANSARPARRSTDGQAILDVLPATGKPGSDLRLCRAPLRNRTVDLLLTIHTSPGSLPGKHFRKDSSSTCLTPALASDACNRQTVARTQSSTRRGLNAQAGTDVRQGLYAAQDRPVALHTGQTRLRRRSDDGQAIFTMAPGQALKTVLSRGFIRAARRI